MGECLVSTRGVHLFGLLLGLGSGFYSFVSLCGSSGLSPFVQAAQNITHFASAPFNFRVLLLFVLLVVDVFVSLHDVFVVVMLSSVSLSCRLLCLLLYAAL